MRSWILAAAAGGAVMLLGSCATMSAEQCQAGDWSGQGYADGVAGLTMSRLHDHAEACAKQEITPDAAAYGAGREQGLIQYCTWERGFREGRLGSSYAGVCPSYLEAEFVPAYRDGQIVYQADQALVSARSLVNSHGNRLEELDEKIVAKQAEARAEGLTDQQRETIRNRIQEIRRERADTEREWRRARDAIDYAEREVRDVRWRFQRQYGSW